MSPIFQSLADELTEFKFVKVDTDKHEDRSKRTSKLNHIALTTSYHHSLTVNSSNRITVDSFNIQGLPLFGIFKNGKMVSVYLLSVDQIINTFSADISLNHLHIFSTDCVTLRRTKQRQPQKVYPQERRTGPVTRQLHLRNSRAK